jgi:hypothetical protein
MFVLSIEGLGADPSKPPCQKAKDRRRAKWLEKQAKKNDTQKHTQVNSCLTIISPNLFASKF